MIILKKSINLRLHKWLFGSILISLLVHSALLGGTERPDLDDETSSAVTVKIKPQDALRMVELNRLREEVASAKEALKLLELEVETLREERSAVRRELIEVTNQFQKESGDYRELKLWLAGVPESGAVRKSGQREAQLLTALSEVEKTGGELALKTVEFSEQVWGLIREMPIGKVRQAELRLKLDEMVRLSRRFIAASGQEIESRKTPDTLRTCRVLAVDRTLGVVILSAGSLQGVFPGMVYLSGKDKSLQLKIVSVRPMVAAAVVIKGKMESLAPGMEAAAGIKQESGLSK